MANTTPNRNLPFPAGSDAVDVYPALAQSLATALDNDMAVLAGPIAARPAATTVPVATVWNATDIHILSLSDGTVWRSIAGLQPGDLITSAAFTRVGALLCDGTAYSRTTYAALFAAIGTASGGGDGSTTFNVPDYRGRSIVGAGAGPGLTARGIGNRGGEEAHVLSAGENAPHIHGLSDPGHLHAVVRSDALGASLAIIDGNISDSPGSNRSAIAYWSGGFTQLETSSAGTGISMGSSGNGFGHNNMQPYAVANIFIAY